MEKLQNNRGHFCIMIVACTQHVSLSAILLSQTHTQTHTHTHSRNMTAADNVPPLRPLSLPCNLFSETRVKRRLRSSSSHPALIYAMKVAAEGCAAPVLTAHECNRSALKMRSTPKSQFFSPDLRTSICFLAALHHITFPFTTQAIASSPTKSVWPFQNKLFQYILHSIQSY